LNRRRVQVQRKTRETEITVQLDLEGSGRIQVDTGVGFFNHILEAFAFHGCLDLVVSARGDLEVDAHHLVEDTGICVGRALAQALDSVEGIERYGTAWVPMDESLAMVCLDISGRPYLHFEGPPAAGRVGDFDCGLVEEFFRAVVNNARITLHVRILYGSNAHHQVEAVFKAFGRALRSAAARRGYGGTGAPSTKGTLD